MDGKCIAPAAPAESGGEALSQALQRLSVEAFEGNPKLFARFIFGLKLRTPERFRMPSNAQTLQHTNAKGSCRVNLNPLL